MFWSELGKDLSTRQSPSSFLCDGKLAKGMFATDDVMNFWIGSYVLVSAFIQIFKFARNWGRSIENVISS